MSRRRRNALILVCVVLTFGLVLYFGVLEQRRTTSTNASDTVMPAGGSIPANASPPVVTQSSAEEFQRPGGPYVSSDPRWAALRNRDKTDPKWEWKMPINFYGQVLDENNRPVGGAIIAFSWTDLSQAGNSAATTVSDSDGRFSLEGKTGRHLQVDVSKAGYYKVKSERFKSFDFAAFWDHNFHEPSPARPVTFHLRTKGNAEDLRTGEVNPGLSANGAPTRLDLLDRGRLSATGQVEIAAVTNTEKYPPPKFDWKASISMHDGGLVEHNLEFPFQAPADGYQTSVSFEMMEDSPAWERSIEKAYFVRFGDPPIYGRIYVRLNGASQKAFLRYAINPTGSRNLEAHTDGDFSQP